jgi:hypothetical protein
MSSQQGEVATIGELFNILLRVAELREQVRMLEHQLQGQNPLSQQQRLETLLEGVDMDTDGEEDAGD